MTRVRARVLILLATWLLVAPSRAAGHPAPFSYLDVVFRDGAMQGMNVEAPVELARAVSTPEEHLQIVPLGQARAEMADMRTMVIVGSSQTRTIQRSSGVFLYTPRSADVS